MDIACKSVTFAAEIRNLGHKGQLLLYLPDKIHNDDMSI